MDVSLQLSDIWVVSYWLILALVLLRIVFRKRSSVSSSLAWFLIIVIFPIFGVILYVFFGEIQLGARRAERALRMREPFVTNLTSQAQRFTAERPENPVAQSVFDIMSRQLGTGGLTYRNLNLLKHPDVIFDAWLDDISQAQTSIRAAFYIWHSKGKVTAITDALIAAKKRGVDVELLIDHAGSWRFFLWHKDLRRMQQAGIKIVAALPVSIWRNLFRRVDLRMHRKLLIIDHHVAYSGSMNMADPAYFNIGRQVGPWIDLVIRFEGAAAFGVSKVFSWDWELETGERNFPAFPEQIKASNESMTMIPSGPDIGKDLISQVLLVTIYRAKQSIFLTTPYFVPSEAIFDALCHALQRGVSVTIIVPQKCDSRIAGWASRSFYEEFLRAGGEIRLFKKGLLHAKTVVIDQEVALVGSVNLDARSFQLNFELTFAIYNKEACQAIQAVLNEYHLDSDAVGANEWFKRSEVSRALERLCYFLSPLL
ncbi:MAG: cardiolipin synthase Cls [Idiomarinaceae bacterium HL-53]|nr:MAG: cardiolipin synthase Cls [Idiomarinaceae bacterium HL-53]CUS49011.1 cardiolipin synthase [Idiomarinaceae bacterium HL-53]